MTREPLTIALDANGGDAGVEPTIGGAARLSLEDADLHVLCVGDVERMSRVLASRPHDPSRLSLVHAKDVVPMDAKPQEALEALDDTSVVRAASMVAAGEADAMVSAGNTGATVLAAARSFARLEGIRRAALASVYPTTRRHGPKRDPFGLMLDVGATLQATPDDLIGFAVMGSAYSSIVSEIPQPAVALLSNGHEPTKGTPAIVEAHRRLLASGLNFQGNIEGLDIATGRVDVVVCDGFLGNVVLKMIEGMGDVLRTLTTEASARKLQWRIGLSMLGGGIEELKKRTDWKVYGGAPLLGLDQVVIKAHGRSEDRAIRNALKVAAKTVRGGLVDKIHEGMGNIR